MNRYLGSFFIAFISYALFGLFIFYFLINEKIIIEKPKNLQAISLNHIKIESEIKDFPKNIVEDKIVENSIQEELIEEQEMEVEKIEESIVEKVIEEKLEKKVEETPKKIIPKEIKKEVKKEIKKPIEKKKEITKKQIILKPVKEVKKQEIAKKTEIVQDKIVNKDIQKQKIETTAISQTNSNQVVNHKKAYLDENLVRIRNLINQNIKYPKRARKFSIEGIVTVKFKILENGSVENLIIIDGHKFLQDATLEAIKEASKNFPKANTSIEIQIPIAYKLI
ncbi:MAG: TonB family protein [Aliarcobacter sp.]|jgi:protein TonB|nr:TonB family protein [Aliarcobacter sp.]